MASVVEEEVQVSASLFPERQMDEVDSNVSAGKGCSKCCRLARQHQVEAL